MRFNWMGSHNPRYIVWIDAKVGRFWYVLQWLKGLPPFMYRSTDATPPKSDNEGCWIFGRRTGARNV